MALAVGSILTGCGSPPSEHSQLPAALSQLPEQLSDARLQVVGIYRDSWADKRVSVTLWQPPGKQEIILRGMVPGVGNPDFRAEAQLLLDDRTICRRVVGVGQFVLQTPVADSPGSHRLSVFFAASQVLPHGDGRRVGARLSFLGFARQTAIHPEGAEIVHPESGIRLGQNWGALETFKNETFRWVQNDAEILLTGTRNANKTLHIIAEAGPGVGARSFLLRVIDRSGRQVDAVEMHDRDGADVFLPVEGNREIAYRFHVDGGGKPVIGDRRILNFRVFTIDTQ